MMRVLGLLAAATLVVATGCGAPQEPSALTDDELGARLRALPGVRVDEPASVAAAAGGYHYYVLHVAQPIDHADPSKGTFEQEVSLLHRSTSARVPMVVQTSGYADTDRDKTVELTELLAANQVAIEHRYFGTSRPEPCDWSWLTIRQMADDEHAIIAMLREIYDGAFVSVGGSKGGMTAVFHHRYYPDDVAGTLGYVTPLSLDAPDPRYRDHLRTIGPPACRAAVRAAAVRMVSRWRIELVARAMSQTEHAYTKVAIDAAFESAVVGLEWAFWQMHGVTECGGVPGEAAGPDELFAFLERISPVGNRDDAHVMRSQPYYYQSYSELGYPDTGTDDYLRGFLHHSDDDFGAELPTPEPLYQKQAMRDIADYVEHDAHHLLFIYGEWDPWTGGRFKVDERNDAAVLMVKQGTHASWIVSLGVSERERAFAKLEAWTGVVPMLTRIDHKEAFDESLDVAPDLVRDRAPRAQK